MSNMQRLRAVARRFPSPMRDLLVTVLLLVAAYLFVAGCMVYYMCKYQKEM